MSYNIQEIAKDLRAKFPRIWRCSDSWKWDQMKDSDLLSFDWLDPAIDYSKMSSKEIGRGRTSIVPWVREMKIGDLIFIMGKNSFKGIGIVKSEYNFSGPFIQLGDLEKPAVRIEYIYKVEKSFHHGLKTHNNPRTFAGIDQYGFGLENILDKLSQEIPEAIDTISNRLPVSSNNTFNTMSHLNQILYGPPGTGKTYHTINRSLEIILGPEILKGKTRKALKDEFDGLVKSGQIVFTTFHQSLSYEDFVEGLKPLEPEKEGGNVVYRVEPGLFKQIVEKANTSGNFDDVLEAFKKEISEPEGKPITIETKTTNFDVVYRGGHVFYVQPHASIKENPWYAVNISNIRKVFETGEQDDVYNITYIRKILEFLGNERGLKRDGVKSELEGNFVLIIDEINRGNVSQIFGELITLIEEDKRAGKDEALSVTLPYSKEKFSVPPNLYIIGTMNTADRSVEALDVALRRRFTFEHMPPDYTLDELQHPIGDTGKKLADLLRIINDRIKFLKDEDHQIGHSYFLNKTTEDQLKETFDKNIIPLLKEYFYNDHSKIRLVLGDGFVKRIADWKPEFASDDEVLEATSFELVPMEEVKIFDALEITLGIKRES